MINHIFIVEQNLLALVNKDQQSRFSIFVRNNLYQLEEVQPDVFLHSIMRVLISLFLVLQAQYQNTSNNIFSTFNYP